MKKDDEREDEFDDLTTKLLSCLTELKNNLDNDKHEEIKLAENILNELNKETAQNLNSEGSVIRNFAFKKYLMDNVEAFDNYKDFVNRILSIRDYKTTTIVHSKEEREKKFKNRLKNNFKKESKLYDSEEGSENFFQKIIENDFDSIKQERNIVEKYNEAAMFIQYEISGNYDLDAVDKLIDLLGKIREQIVDASVKLSEGFVSDLNDAVKNCTTPEELINKLNTIDEFTTYYVCVKNDEIPYIKRKKQEIVDDNENVKPVPRLSVTKNSTSTKDALYKIESGEIKADLYKTEKTDLQECPDDKLPDCINSKDSVKIIQSVYRFSFDATSSDENTLVWNGTKIDGAQIMYSKAKGWLYKSKGKEVKEFSVYIYKRQPSTATGVGKAFMNGHHGIPSEWAKCRCHCGGLYDPDDAPVLMLRDTKDGSTHRFITNLQCLWKKYTELMQNEKCTYKKIKKVAREQLYLAAEEYGSLDENSTYDYNKDASAGLLFVGIRGNSFYEKVDLELSKHKNEEIKEQILDSIDTYFKAADKYFKEIYDNAMNSAELNEDEKKQIKRVFEGGFDVKN